MKNLINKFINLFLFITAAAIISGCGSKGNENAQANNKSQKEIVDTISVIVSKVESKPLTISKTYTGTIEGEEQANVVSQLAERIVGIDVKVGSSVRAGQVIVRLEKSGTMSQYYQAQANFKNSEKNYERMKSLFESGAISRQALDQTQTAYEIAKANFEAAKNAVEITSPISGVVTDIKLSVGDFTQPGVPIAVIAKISSLKLIMNIGEADIPYVKLDQKVKIYSELNNSITADGKITEIAKHQNISKKYYLEKIAGELLRIN